MNSPVWEDSPVTEVLAKVLETTLPQRVSKKDPKAGKEFVVLSYRNDFVKIWNLDGRIGNSIVGWARSGDGATLRTLVLVWDGMPPQQETINVADFVLPFDWAFAVSVSAIREPGAHEKRGRNLIEKSRLPNLRILILDLESENHSSAFSAKLLPAFGYAMPWIQIYKPLQSDRVELAALFSDSNDDYTISLLRNAIMPGSLGIEALMADLKMPNRLLSLREAFTEHDRSSDIEALISLYKSSMLSAGTRHDVGNLLAPLLLVNELPQNQRRAVKKTMMEDYPLRTALRNLATIIGLEGNESKPKSNSSSAGVIKETQEDGDISSRRSNIRFLLMDDQFSLGYQHLLASVLFGDGYDPSLGKGDAERWRVLIRGAGELTCVSSAESLLLILESLEPVTDWDEPRFLDVPSDILILDLRLWTNSTGREAFFDRLLKVCKQLGAENIPDDKFKRALQRAGIGSSDKSSEQGEVEALALFPLLLSHLDPSVPIVLFSSTHQRAVLELVSHRPNIVNDFAKPILSGYGEERSAAQVIADLKGALRKAVQLHEIRGAWSRLRNTEWKISPVFECRTRRSDGSTVMGVYNAPESSVVSADRTGIGPARPRTASAGFRKLLAADFVQYIQRSNSFDYASIPWEILEGTLIPEEVLDDTGIMNPDFGFSHDLIFPPELRNFVPRALEFIRHKKAHGQVPLSDRSDLEVFRVGAILQLSFLLDFVEGSSSKALPLQPSLDTLWNYLRVRHKNLIINNLPPQPRRLISDNKVPWLDFIAYTFLWTAERATDGAVRYLSEDTVKQVQNLAQSLSDPFWRDLDSMVNSRRVIAGTVQKVRAKDFVVAASPGFWGLLPKSRKTSQLKAGDPCTVIIARRSKASGEEIIFD
jgi:hypothetical protein